MSRASASELTPRPIRSAHCDFRSAEPVIVTVPRWVAMTRSIASERPVITSRVASPASVLFETSWSDGRGPPVPRPRITATSSQTSRTAGWLAEGTIFSPPLHDLALASTARSSALSMMSASARSVASQSITGRSARPVSQGWIHGAAIRPPFRSIAKISTSGQRASWARSTLSRFDLPEPRRPTMRVATSRSVTAHSSPSW
jgi:hypothetical protein